MAYICPMDVLLEDMKHRLEAKRIYLPGSAEDQAYKAAERAHVSSAGRLIEAGGQNSNIANFNELTLSDAPAASSSSSLPRNLQSIHAAGRLDSIPISQQ